jgi:phage nucleotide-binding protein
MAIKVIKASDLKINGNLNVLVYGPPGIGKTTFAATAPKPLIIDVEGGTMSIMDREVDIVKAVTSYDVNDAIQHAISNKYETIVFDSLTRYSEILMDSILSEARVAKPQIQHWGELITRIKKAIWKLQTYDINTIFICLEKEFEEDKHVIKRPMLNGNLSQSIPAIMDVCAYLYVNDLGERVMSVNGNARFYAKHRTPRQNSIKEDIAPDFMYLKERIFNKIKIEKNVPAAPMEQRSNGTSIHIVSELMERIERLSELKTFQLDSSKIMGEAQIKVNPDEFDILSSIVNEHHKNLKEKASHV